MARHSDRLRITFLIPRDDLTGGIRIISGYATLLHERGHHVHIVSGIPGQLHWKDRLRALKRREWQMALRRQRPIRGHIARSGVPTTVIHRSNGLRAEDLPDADIVVATWWETAKWLSAMPRSKGVPVHFVQDYEVWGGDRSEVDSVYRINSPKITVSRWLEDLLRDQFGQQEITLIPNPADLGLFHAVPRGRQPRPTVGYVYTYFMAKGCDLIAEAIDIARRSRPDLVVKCFGSVLPTPQVPIPQGVEFELTPSQERIREIYSSCDVWLFGSRKEGFGLPILEAMACRTPVIATPAGVAPELLAGGGGILLEDEQPARMAEAILRFCELTDAQWRTISQAASDTATNHTWHDAGNLFELALFDAVRKV